MKSMKLLLVVLSITSLTALGFGNVKFPNFTEDGLITIEKEHSEVHKGNYYFAKDFVDLTGAGDVLWFMFQTPDEDIEINARVLMSGEAEFTIELAEGGTVSNSGNVVTLYNANRRSSKTSSLVAYADSTVTATGNIFWRAKTGSGRNATGVAPALGYEIIASPDTVYLFKITKAASGTHYLDFDFFYYEEKENY